MQKLIKWLGDTYNGLFRILLKPYMPHKRTFFGLLGGFIAGLVWAYVLAPTIYYNGALHQLSPALQRDYVQLLSAEATVPEGYDDATITDRLRLVDSPVNLVDAIIADPNTAPSARDRAQQIRPLAEAAAPGTRSPQPPGLIGELLGLIFAVVLFVILATVAIVLFSFALYPIVWKQWIMGRIRPKKVDESVQRIRDTKEAEAELKKKMAADVSVSTLGTPTMRRPSVFLKGRGSFDESYAIEDASEMFLGECGAGIAETIGPEDDVSAIEIWLFDKEDFVRTLTKVFASEHAYNDPAVRSKLELRGEVYPARPGETLILETGALRLQAKVVEVLYDDGPNPPNSAFKKVAIDIAVWQLGSAPVAVPAVPAGIPAGSGMPAAPTYAPPPQQMPPAMPQAYPPQPPAYSPPPASYPQQPPPPGGVRPLMPPPPRLPEDDDPFGGTGDFTPIGG